MKPGQVKVEKYGGGAIERIARLRALENTSIQVGIQGDVAAEGPSDASTLPTIAARLEYGDPEARIPARPWMRTTADQYGKEWAKGLEKVVRLTAKDEADKAQQGLRIVGVQAVGNMQDTLRDGNWAPNTEFTKRQKWEQAGRPGTLDSFVSQPLIDSGQLVQSHRAALIQGGKREVIG